MKKIISITFLFLLTFSFAKSQDTLLHLAPAKKVKGSLYFAWGYNRDWFSKSDIHFKNTSDEVNNQKGGVQSYDFTIYDATARDRPGIKDIFRTDLTIPQYNYRIGYYFNKKYDMGIEINFDHTKYIMEDYQTRHVTGTIHGHYIDQDTLIDPHTFLHFEHSDGANFLMLNFMKRQKLLVSKNDKHWLSGVAKVGFGPVIPRTDITMFGDHINNCFHIAGYCTGVELGLRYDAFKHVYLEYTGKGTFANYRHVLAYGPGRAHHYFWTFENILVLGFEFGI